MVLKLSSERGGISLGKRLPMDVSYVLEHICESADDTDSQLVHVSLVTCLGVTYSRLLGNEYIYLRNTHRGWDGERLVLASHEYVRDNIASPPHF